MFTESQLVIPAINALRNAGGSASTRDIIEVLKKSLPLEIRDNSTVPSSSTTTYFERAIYNLKSNKHLERLGLVKHSADGFILTAKGRSIGMQELEDKIDIQFSRKSNILSNQAAMVHYVRNELTVKFVNAKLAAGEIRKKFGNLPKITNDDDRVTIIGVLVEEYVTGNPKNVKIAA